MLFRANRYFVDLAGKNRRTMFTRLIIALSFITLSLSGCEKDDGRAVVRLTVINENGIPIQNCNVKLSVPVSPETTWGVDYFFAVTDQNGVVQFESSVNAYFDVFVWKGYWEGCDFVEFIPNEVNIKNIIIYPPGTTFNGCL